MQETGIKGAFAHRQMVVTDDGSHTLWLPDLNEHYHSTFGAISESMHVFIRAGLDEAMKTCPEIRLLEVGFGTGLNALLAFMRAEESGIPLTYTAIEPFPVEDEWITTFNYTDLISHPGVSDWWHFIHRTAHWMETTPHPSGSTLFKWQGALQDFPLPDQPFHLIFFDAFAPTVQPELWTEEIFRKVSRMMAPGALLVTYSSKGSVRRAMAAAGLRVEKLPGPEGKREMVRAVKLQQ